MKSQIWTYGITVSLILSVLLSSCSSPYRIIDSLHDSIHSVSSLFSGVHVHDHSHDFLELLEQQHKDSQHKKYVIDSQNSKITNDIYVLSLSYAESNFASKISVVNKMLDAEIIYRLYRPPIA